MGQIGALHYPPFLGLPPKRVNLEALGGKGGVNRPLQGSFDYLGKQEGAL